jgi:hypothetical protein
MNCREFKFHLMALARLNRAHAATAERDALSHAGSCAACAGLLAEQRELSAQFRQLSAGDAGCGPSQEQEFVLRSAYRSMDRTVAPAAAAGNWKPWASAIAAMVLVTLAGIALSRKIPDWLATAPAGPEPRPAAPEPARVAVIPRAPAPAENRQSLPAPKARLNARTVEAPMTSPASASEEPSDSRVAQPQMAAIDDAASDFVPLPYAGDPMLAGSGAVVRVEMTGAMLQLLGFPITGESSARRVQADLVLGQDGFARAIRFVP